MNREREVARLSADAGQPAPAAPAQLETFLRFARAFTGLTDAPDADVLDRLHADIASTRAEIAAAAPTATARHHLPAAGMEIKAAERDLSDAAERIMASAEALLDGEFGDLVSYRAFVHDHALQIMEACIFHDLVGQRLTKVSGVLETVEARLGRLADKAGVPDAELAETAAERRSRTLILNGPQISGPGTSQSDIDRLFETR
jgi:chemotaxis protein CheZ